MSAGARPLAQATADGAVHYLHADVRGDVRVVTDAAGAVTGTLSYSVDGAVTERTGATPVSVGWNGEYTDPDTGMVWLRARWYDPGSARFISADPWHGDPGVPVSLNRYLFANADPVNNTDPTGLSTLIEQEASMALRLEINSISAGYYIGMLSTLRTATTVLATTAGVLATSGAAYWAVTAHAGDPNDQEGIDGPGTVPDIEVHERDSTETEVQPQTDGAGARSGGPVGCEAEPGVTGGAQSTNDGVVYMRTDRVTGRSTSARLRAGRGTRRGSGSTSERTRWQTIVSRCCRGRALLQTWTGSSSTTSMRVAVREASRTLTVRSTTDAIR